MTDATELAQRTDLLIANGQQTADLLRHLADNEIDSDYFAVTSECEAYGTEIDAELTITDFALRAAGYVDVLVEALEAAEKRNAELEEKQRLIDICQGQGLEHRIEAEKRAEVAEKRIAELEARTVKLPESFYPDGDIDCPLAVNLDDVKEMLQGIGVAVEGDTNANNN